MNPKLIFCKKNKVLKTNHHPKSPIPSLKSPTSSPNPPISNPNFPIPGPLSQDSSQINKEPTISLPPPPSVPPYPPSPPTAQSPPHFGLSVPVGARGHSSAFHSRWPKCSLNQVNLRVSSPVRRCLLSVASRFLCSFYIVLIIFFIKFSFPYTIKDSEHKFISNSIYYRHFIFPFSHLSQVVFIHITITPYRS